jgi:phosphoenolpyruvate synthase/pyruvate phosphate dikinase
LLNPLCFDKGNYLNIIIQKASRQHGLPAADIEAYTEREIVNLFDGVKVPQGELENRRRAYAIYKDASEETCLIAGREAQELISRLDAAMQGSEVAVISGKVAHGKGMIVRGRAAVISRDYADEQAMHRRIEAMSRGDILVSETTEPSMMAAFHKAAAVVTDIGGMLSHAAITARELGLPCIVGTGNASRSIKDGDMVEVDAEKGVVKILKQ